MERSADKPDHPGSCAYLPLNAYRSLLRRFPFPGIMTAAKRLTALTMALAMMLMGQSQAFAQQMYPTQGYSQPSYSQPYGQPAYPQQTSYPSGYSQYPQQNYSGAPQQSYAAPQQPAAQGLGPDQLEQLVAPIALYPDNLVAQILTASTYPAQVVDADRWRQAQGYSSADRIAAGADVQPWDPSVKGLTAFPQILGELDQNLRWTNALGTAYYNQPQDLFQAIQVLRQRAQSAGSLQNTQQEAVSYNQGNILLAPVDPQVVYVPAYNPWTVYGQPITPYPGFSLLSVLGSVGSFFSSALGSSAVRFGIGIALNAFTGMSWSWLGWGLNWLVHAIFFHQSNYFTHSTTVADWGLPHGGPRAYGFHGGIGHGNDLYHNANGYGRPGGYNGASGFNRTPTYSSNRPGESRPAESWNRSGYQTSGNAYSHNGQEAFNRTPQMPGRSQQYGGYGSNSFSNRPGTTWGGSQQSYRAPSSNFRQNNSFMSRNNTKSFEKQQHDFAKQQHNEMKSFEKQQHSFGGSSHASKSFSGGGKSFSSHSSGGGHSSGGKHHFL